MANYVQFTWHASERVLGRFSGITSYAQVQTVLQGKPLRNGTHKVPIAKLGSTVRVYDPEARNGQYIEGNTVKAIVDVTNGNEVQIITIVLE